MNAGYVRLSKDDDKRNYASIENQKLIIRQYAAEHHVVIDRWYEDDGISGYVLDRPGLRRLLADLDTEIDAVYVKDFSRLGRHNAKILLLLDEFQERGKRLVAVDDNYDNAESDDDLIGIKTWFNERYVKDVSKKIRRVIGAKQKDGSLVTLPPFGYCRTEEKSGRLEIVPQEAAVIREIFSLYIGGCGYRKLAAYLNQTQTPTPSAARRERMLSDGKISRRPAAAAWSGAMVKEILGNDFYTGVLRLHKRERVAVHGKDLRVPKEDHILFENHHPPVVSRETYNLVQEIKSKRIKSGYKGSSGPWSAAADLSPLGSCLFCKSCGHKMTRVTRRQNGRERNYYICSLYNSKGREYCAKPHLIEEERLTDDLLRFLTACQNALRPALEDLDLSHLQDRPEMAGRNIPGIPEQLIQAEKQLNVLISQKIRDIARHPDAADILSQGYDTLQQALSEKIRRLRQQLAETAGPEPDHKPAPQTPPSAWDHISQRFSNGRIGRAEAELLIERIEVDEYGFPEIYLKYSLPSAARRSISQELSHRLDSTLLAALELLRENTRGYASARAMLSGLAEKGFELSRRDIHILLSSFIAAGILEQSGDKQKPYRILLPPEKIEEMIRDYPNGSPAEWSAQESGSM